MWSQRVPPGQLFQSKEGYFHKNAWKNKVTPPVKTRAVLHSGISDVLQDMWHSCPKVFAIVVSVLPAVRPLPKALIDMAGL